ncbi:hypothetical protein AJ87_39575 [Rhizobium yanglingense]|nr:hypothetical protein AJ87_39575 [Rhizobium yanglingense]
MVWAWPFASGDHLHCSAGGDRCVIVLQDRRAILLDRERVMVLDQQPVGSLTTFAIVAHAHQHEAAMQAFAFEGEFEVALFQSLLRALLSFRLPIAAVP